MEYKIVTGRCDESCEKELMEAVNEHLRDGWVPIGGPFTLPGRMNVSYPKIRQAMTRENPMIGDTVYFDGKLATKTCETCASYKEGENTMCHCDGQSAWTPKKGGE